MKAVKIIENESVALDYLGNAFIKIPRSIIDRLNSVRLVERQMARLHLCLFGLCYHTDGYVMLDKRKVYCRRGEYVGTQRRLAEVAGINPGSLSRLIDKMVKLQLISVTHIPGGSRIWVKGYAAFTWIQESKETQKNASNTNASAQMAEAERNMGGRSMQNPTNQPN